jgi:hypothetical protein
MTLPFLIAYESVLAFFVDPLFVVGIFFLASDILLIAPAWYPTVP